MGTAHGKDWAVLALFFPACEKAWEPALRDSNRCCRALIARSSTGLKGGFNGDFSSERDNDR